MKTREKFAMGRRRFFGLLGTGVAASAAAAFATDAVADSETEDERRKARYKETDEVKTYYRVNRYPS